MIALNGEKSPVELAERFEVHPNQISAWKAQLQSEAVSSFEAAAERREGGEQPNVMAMQAKIGRLALENDSSASSHGWPIQQEAVLPG